MGDKDNQFTAPLRRPRAPTITLDTSAVNEHIGKSFTLWNLLLDDEALAAGVWLCGGTMTCGLLCKLQATGKSCYLEEEASLSDLRCRCGGSASMFTRHAWSGLTKSWTRFPHENNHQDLLRPLHTQRQVQPQVIAWQTLPCCHYTPRPANFEPPRTCIYVYHCEHAISNMYRRSRS